MRNLTTGLVLGFVLGLLLSGVADALDGGGFPVLNLILSMVLIIGIVAEILRVRKSESAIQVKADRESSHAP